MKLYPGPPNWLLRTLYDVTLTSEVVVDIIIDDDNKKLKFFSTEYFETFNVAPKTII